MIHRQKHSLGVFYIPGKFPSEMSSVDRTSDRWRPFGFDGVQPLVAFLVLFGGIVLASNVLWNTVFEVEANPDNDGLPTVV
jgi:hypothetical protein